VRRKVEREEEREGEREREMRDERGEIDWERGEREERERDSCKESRKFSVNKLKYKMQLWKKRKGVWRVTSASHESAKSRAFHFFGQFSVFFGGKKLLSWNADHLRFCRSVLLLLVKGCCCDDFCIQMRETLN
jgi:hypothetical protein